MPKKSLTDLVLDTIDIISARKNRPNLLRIYRHLNRLYDLNLQTCELLLKTLLSERRVIRVTYKGHTSYRNALKWKKYSYYMMKNMYSDFPGSLITNAISELIVAEPDYLHMGVPYDILEQQLLTIEDLHINKETIQKVLQRELNLESLQQYDNGNYFLGPKPPKSNAFERLEVGNSETLDNKQVNNNESSSHIDKKQDKNYSKYNITNNNNRNDSLNIEKVVSESEDDNSNDTMDFLMSKKCIVSNVIQTSQANISTFNRTNEDISSHEVIQDNNHYRSRPGTSSKELKDISRLGNNDIKVIDVDSSSFMSDGMDNVSEMSVSSLSEDQIGMVDRNKESSDDTENDISTANTADNSDCKTSSCTTPVKDYNSNEDETEEKATVSSPILERGKRKKKTTYDESFYYFPSLKRTHRDAKHSGTSKYSRGACPLESRKKEEQRRKKKKKKKDKKETSSNSFVRKVMFPGNSSMCCECKCYGSKVKSDTMITCATCSNEGHQSCALKTKVGKEWYCLDCRKDAKLCRICDRMPHEKDRGVLYMCSQCGDHYHKGCHNPVIKLPFSDSWRCYTCPVKNSTNYFDGQEPPDSSKWSTEDVYAYFRKHLDKDTAKAIYEQDIDGETLKLMDRSDVLNLNFKLGIRLQILLHVKRLQLRTNNLHEIWES